MITVLILAAGYGRRMGPFSRMINKGLVPYDNKPLISHIMDKFDSDARFVIACGHMGQQVKDYVSVVHSEKNITFVDIDQYDEGTTGPATTIQKCYPHIQGPFIWLSCDTLFDFDYVSNMDHNWIGVHPVDSNISQDYCWVKRNGDRITQINNKQACNHAVDAFVGLMYCKDSMYVDNLKAAASKEAYEGLLDNLDLRAHTVHEWLDFGTYDKWVDLSKDLPEVSFPKPNELFFQDNGRIIKFTVDKALAEKKFVRALINPECLPNNVTLSGQFLVYDYADGDIVYNVLTPKLFDDMLLWSEQHLWKTTESTHSYDTCRKFYKKKTLGRLNDFRIKYNEWDEPTVVNGMPVKSINDYLEKIDWDWLCNTTEWRFIHGDFQFENIVYNEHTSMFTCIDWRTDFGGDSYGDLYYDLAKMAGGISLNYQAVKADQLEYHEDAGIITLNDCSIPNAKGYLEQLQRWCTDKDLDYRKVELLIPIIFLNMSPLHDAPFDKYLFALSQYYFSKFFDEHTNSNR